MTICECKAWCLRLKLRLWILNINSKWVAKQSFSLVLDSTVMVFGPVITNKKIVCVVWQENLLISVTMKQSSPKQLCLDVTCPSCLELREKSKERKSVSWLEKDTVWVLIFKALALKPKIQYSVSKISCQNQSTTSVVFLTLCTMVQTDASLTESLELKFEIKMP